MSKKRPWRGITYLTLIVIVLSACGTRRPAPVEERGNPRVTPTAVTKSASYTVRTGDTMYSIAFRYNVDWRELARWNNIGSPYLIHPGDRLRLTAPPASSVASNSNRRLASSARNGTRASTSKGSQSSTSSPSKPPTQTTGAATSQTSTQSKPKKTSSGSKASSQKNKPSDRARAKAPNTKSGKSTTSPPKRSASPPPKNTSAKTSTTTSKQSAGVKWRWPVPGRILRGFRANSTGREGLDLAGKLGETVHSAAAGTVVYSGTGLIGYGELIIIKHNDRLLSAYGHNRKRLVSEGENVSAGQAISEMGQNSSGQAQLHFEIRVEGKPQNPVNFLPSR